MSTRTPVALAVSILIAAVASAEDWPGWMGAQRDGVYRETGIIDVVPSDGLPVKWRTAIHGGYAGPAVADGRVFVFDYERRDSDEVAGDPEERTIINGKERLIALDEQTGVQLWQHAYDCPYSIDYPAGPRCTPTVDGDYVYVLGSEGELRCLRVSDGELVWSINFERDFSAKVPTWGFSGHPLIDGDVLYAMVGGKGQGVVAFEKLTGEVRWKSLDTRTGYCPPTIIEAGGARQLIIFHPEGISSLNPEDGSFHWDVPIKPAHDMSIARPVVEKNLMFGSGNNEAIMIELAADRPAAKELWRVARKGAILSSNTTSLIVDGVIYGVDNNEGQLVAASSIDGSRLWQTFDVTNPREKRRLKQGTAFVTRIRDTNRYLLMSETGDLHMARMTPDGYEDLGRFHVLERTGHAFGRDVVWSHPAYANRTAYIRNDKEIVAVDLAR